MGWTSNKLLFHVITSGSTLFKDITIGMFIGSTGTNQRPLST